MRSSSTRQTRQTLQQSQTPNKHRHKQYTVPPLLLFNRQPQHVTLTALPPALSCALSPIQLSQRTLPPRPVHIIAPLQNRVTLKDFVAVLAHVLNAPGEHTNGRSPARCAPRKTDRSTTMLALYEQHRSHTDKRCWTASAVAALTPCLGGQNDEQMWHTTPQTVLATKSGIGRRLQQQLSSTQTPQPHKTSNTQEHRAPST